MKRAAHSSVLGLLSFCAALSCVAGCAVAPSDADVRVDTSELAPRIVNGTPSSSAEDAVVMLGIGHDGLCTGTLITPNLVITARHCVSNMDESTECGSFTTNLSPSSLTVSLGADASPYETVAHGTKIFADASKNGCSHDIALLLLDKDVPGAKVAKVRLSKLKVGEAAKTVGYGEDGSGDLTNGRYEKKGLSIDAVGPASYTYETKGGGEIPVDVPPGEIVTGESTCFGDSGGPLMDGTGAVIGVTSRGVDEECIDRPSIYSDTASHAQLIRDAAKASGHPLEEAGETSPADDDEAGESKPSSDDDGAAPDDDDDDARTTSTKRPKVHATKVASAGCSASPARAGGSAAWLWVVGLGLALTSRRRRP